MAPRRSLRASATMPASGTKTMRSSMPAASTLPISVTEKPRAASQALKNGT